MAADGTLKISIGAGLDRSVEASFGSVEKMAERCVRTINKQFGTMGNTGGGTGVAALGRGMRTAASEADKASRQIEADFAKQIKAAEKASAAEIKAFDKSARARIKFQSQVEREIDKGLRAETRAMEREAAKQEKITERSARKVEAEHQRFASRVSHRSVRFLFPNPIGAFGMAHRVGSDILHGAGIDFSMGGMAHRAIQAQEVATNLSNQGFMRNETGANSVRISPAVLEAEARKHAQTAGYTTEQVLSAQTKVVDITGNLHDSRESMGNVLKLAGASNTDPEKMAEAWANVSRHIGDVPNKAEKVYGLMKLIAGQGRVGSDEIKYMAPNLAKIAAMADKYGGDRAKRIGQLTTLSQMAKAEGGAASSREAATSIVSFTNTFGTGSRVKAMMSQGRLKESDIFEMVGTGKNRVRGHIQDPFEIIQKVLKNTGGDISKFGNIFKSVMSQRATNAIVAAYNSDGGHNKAAVDKQFEKFGREAALSDQDVEEAQAARLSTAAVQAKIFQEELDEVGKGIEAELLPALKELAPYALKAAKGLGDLIKWTSKNPGDAIVVAIVAAIGRATLESGFRSLVEKMVLGALPGAGAAIAGAGGSALVGGEVAGGAAAVGGAAAGGLLLPLAGIALLTVGAIEVGRLLVAHADMDKDKPHDTPTPDDKPKVTTALQDNRAVKTLDDLYGVNTDKNDVVNKSHNPQADAWRALFGDASDKAKDKANSGESAAIDHGALATSVARGMRSGGPLQVVVTNMPDDLPTTNSHGRNGDPGKPRSWADGYQ